MAGEISQDLAEKHMQYLREWYAGPETKGNDDIISPLSSSILTQPRPISGEEREQRKEGYSNQLDRSQTGNQSADTGFQGHAYTKTGANHFAWAIPTHVRSQHDISLFPPWNNANTVMIKQEYATHENPQAHSSGRRS
jgi:hypothetical protein